MKNIIIDEKILRQKMKLAYELGVEAYKKGWVNPYGDPKLAKLMIGVKSLDAKYLIKEWCNGSREEGLSEKI
jgi:hypothetical protein